jgi:DNA sulfur modification protein DndB
MRVGRIGKVKKYEEVIVTSKAELQKYRSKGFRPRKRRKHGAILMRRRKSEWEVFEDQILLLLQKGLKLQDVYGGPRARLGGHQIDAAGGAAGTYIVVECKTSKSPDYSSLKRAIKDIIGEKSEIASAVAEKYGARYSEIKFVLALDGIDYGQPEEEYAARNGIKIIGDAYLAMLGQLVGLVGERIKYNLLYDLGVSSIPIRDGKEQSFEVPAFRIRKNNQTSYSFLMKARHLLDLAYVSRIEGGEKNAFQRLLAKRKLESVASFIDGGGVFKNNIVVNFDKIQFKSLQSFRGEGGNAILDRGTLKIPKRFCSVWLVDGQHRLFGYSKCKNQEHLDDWLPVIGLHDASGTEAAKTFVEINQNQKPVDPNIIWALSDEILEGDPRLIAKSLRKLCSEKRSVFNKKIYIPGLARRTKGGYKLYLANFAKGISDRHLLDSVRGLKAVRCGDVSVEVALKDVLKNYFALLCKIVHRAKLHRWSKEFFLTNNGLNVMLRVLDELFVYFRGEFPLSAIKVLITTPIEEYCREHKLDLDDLRRKASSEGTREQIATDIIEVINRYEPAFGAKYLRKHERTLKMPNPVEVLKRLENEMRDLIEKTLSALDSNWWKERIPENVRLRAEERMNKSERVWPWHSARDLSPIYYVDFGDYDSIIVTRNNWDEVFESIFKNKEWVNSTLMELNPIRNDIAHNRPLTLDQIDQLRISAKKISKYITAYWQSKEKTAA